MFDSLYNIILNQYYKENPYAKDILNEIYSKYSRLGIKQIACGENHTIILTNNGQVHSFGNNEYGQLGLNDNINS